MAQFDDLPIQTLIKTGDGTFHSKVLPEANYPKLKPDLSTEVKGKESQDTFLNPIAFEFNPYIAIDFEFTVQQIDILYIYSPCHGSGRYFQGPTGLRWQMAPSNPSASTVWPWKVPDRSQSRHGFIGDFHTLGTIEWAFNRGNGINGVMLGYSGAELGQSLVDIDEKKVG